MEGVRDWIRGIAVLTVFAGAVEMVLPSGDMRKYARTVLGLLIVLCIVAPLARILSGDASLILPFQVDAPQAGFYDSKTAKAFEWQAEALARSVPGVKEARAAVRFKDATGVALPRGLAAVESVRVAVWVGGTADNGAVEPVPAVVPAGARGKGGDAGPGGNGGPDVRWAVRDLVASRFGIPPEAVVIEVAGGTRGAG